MDLKRERIKSILLVILVVMTVVLVRLMINDASSKNMVSLGKSESEPIIYSEYINPQSYFVSFGGQSYTRVYLKEIQDQTWKLIYPYYLSTFINGGEIQKIELEEYVEAFSYQSILMSMPDGLTLKDIFEALNAEPISLDWSDIQASEILVSNYAPNYIYIFDHKSGQYYKVENTEPADVDRLEKAIDETIQSVKNSDFLQYRKISDRFSLKETTPDDKNNQNYELLPYQYTVFIPTYTTSNEVDIESDVFVSQAKVYLDAVFGNRLDFVKRLKDINGSVIYMYGYGDKTLTFNKDGSVVFDQKIDQSTAREITFKEAIDIAAHTISAFGPELQDISLSRYEEEVGNNTKRIFTFSYFVTDYEVASESGKIIVTLDGNQLLSINRNVKNIESFITAPTDTLYSIDSCITQNYLEVSIYYLQDNDIYDASLNSIQYYFSIRGAIQEIDLQYFLKEDEMIPIWRVVISDRTYYFNAYNGEMLGNYLE